jgi:CO/xanthine dehydrogenase Mo-binding subunit
VDRVRFVGDPVAAVAAPTKREAEEALNLIDVEYEALPGVYDAVEAVSERAPLVHEHHPISDNDAAYFGMRPQEGTNICHRFRIRHGDIDEGFGHADVIVEETYRTAGAQPAPMEPHASVARWEEDRLEIWTGTQTPFNLRMDLAGIFKIPESQIRIICPPMGGAFGAKTFVRGEAIIACLARKAGRPVKLVLNRYEEWLTQSSPCHPAREAWCSFRWHPCC